jgi:hypothetical protein
VRAFKYCKNAQRTVIPIQMMVFFLVRLD